MKAVKYVFAGLLMMGLSAPVLAQTSYESALETVSKALKADPSGLASAKSAVKDYQKAFKKDPAAMVALGNTYLAVKNYPKAIECADLALKKNKHYGDAFVLKGDVEALKDDGGEAAMWYQQAMSLDPKNPDGYMRYANVYRKRSPAEAERVLNELRKNIPDYPIEAESAHIFYTSGQYDKAMEYFNKANPEKLTEGRLGEYALAALSNENFDKGLEVSKIAIRRFPSNHGFVRLALLNAISGKNYGEAVEFAKKLVNSGADVNAGDYSYYGQALAGNGQFAEAIEQYNKAYSMDAENVKVLQYISEAYTGMGDEDKALEYANQYMDKNPTPKVSEYNKLATIYIAKVKEATDPAVKAENFAKAMAVYDKVAEKVPAAATWAKFQKGYQAYAAELDDEALQQYLPLINELENKSGLDDDETNYLKTAYRSVGYIYWSSKKDLTAATPFFEKLYKLDPTDKLAKQALGLDQEPAVTTE